MALDGVAPEKDDASQLDTWALVKRAQVGDRAAFERLFSRFGSFLTPIASYRMSPALRKREEVDDVVQSCLREAIEALPRLRPVTDGRIQGWLVTILSRKLSEKHDRHFAQKRRPEGGALQGSEARDALAAVAAPTPTPSQNATAGEGVLRLLAALDRLDDSDRAVLGYAYYLDLGFREIGEMLGCSTDAARMRAARAIKALRSLYVPG